jgi:hypothetical protein
MMITRDDSDGDDETYAMIKKWSKMSDLLMILIVIRCGDDVMWWCWVMMTMKSFVMIVTTMVLFEWR